LTWSHSGYHKISTTPPPGEYAAYLVDASEGYTPRQGLPKVELRFRFENGYEANFALIFGYADWLDRKHSLLMDDLHAIAGLPADGRHPLGDLVAALRDIPIGVALDADPSERSRTGLRLKEVFSWADDEPESPEAPDANGDDDPSEDPAARVASEDGGEDEMSSNDRAHTRHDQDVEAFGRLA